MSIIGKTTINPWIFYTGKTAGYLCWLAGALFFFGVIKNPAVPPAAVRYVSTFCLAAGALFTIISMVNLALPPGSACLMNRPF